MDLDLDEYSLLPSTSLNQSDPSSPSATHHNLPLSCQNSSTVLKSYKGPALSNDSPIPPSSLTTTISPPARLATPALGLSTHR